MAALRETWIRIYILRALSGALFLAAGVGWWFVIEAGRDLDTYQYHLRATQKILIAEGRERDIQAEIIGVTARIYEGMQDCSCDGDIGELKELHDRFIRLTETEARYRSQTMEILEAYQREGGMDWK